MYHILVGIVALMDVGGNRQLLAFDTQQLVCLLIYLVGY